MSFIKNTLIKFKPMQLNTILIILSIGIIKVPGVVRDILLTFYFGINKNLDIYLYALIVPMFCYGVLSLSLNYFFIPAYLKVKSVQGNSSSKVYAGVFLRNISLMIIGIGFLCGWIIPLILVKLNPTFFNHYESVEYFYKLSKTAAVFLIVYMISSFFVSLLQAEHQYFVSLYPQILIPGISILFLVLYHQSLGVVSALYGAVGGGGLSFFIFYLYSFKKGFVGRRDQTQDIKLDKIQNEQFFILIIALILPSMISIIDQQMASVLGPGKISTLVYGMRIPDGLTETFSLGLGIAIFSHFSQWHIDQKKSLIVEATQKIVTVVTYLILPICFFLFLYSEPIISLIFERGEFSSVATLAVSQILQMYAFTFYFSALAIVGVRIISAMGYNQFFIVLGVIVLIFKLITNFLFISIFDIRGIVLATLLTQILNFLLIYLYLNKKGICVFKDSFLKNYFKSFLVLGVVFLIFYTVRLQAMMFPNMFAISLGLIALIIYMASVFFFNQRKNVI